MAGLTRRNTLLSGIAATTVPLIGAPLAGASAADLDVPTAASTKPSERELAMAEQLVESLSTEFEPSKYHDEYREKVLELIERKADGEVIAPASEPTTTAPVVDLMAALEASLAAARAGKESGRGSDDKVGARRESA